MRDPGDQVRSYAERAAAEVPPVSAADALAVSRGAHPSSRRRTERMVWLAAAAAVVVIVGAVAMWGMRGDGRDADVVSQPSSVPSTSTPSPTRPPRVAATDFGYAPGWHDLDPGPLSPRSGAALAWTGAELVVLGGERHHDGGAYDPGTRTWRRIAESPLPDGVPRVAWTGTELYAATATGDGDGAGAGRTWTVAAYDPASDVWRAIVAPPAGRHQGPAAMIWAGGELLLLDAMLALDPDSGSWRHLAVPSGASIGGMTTAAWASERVVFAGVGVPAWTLDPSTDTWGRLDAPPDPGGRASSLSGGSAASLAVGDRVLFVDAGNNAAVLDLATAQWSALPPIPGQPAKCLPHALLVAKPGPLVNMCTVLVAQGASGWRVIEGAAPGCCYPTFVSTGWTVLQWSSNDDTVNDASAPYRRLRLWVASDENPPGTAVAGAPPSSG